MKKIALLAIIAVSMIACNKNQRKIKRLEGTWVATSFQTTDADGNITDFVKDGEGTYQVTFEKCKLKDDEFCTYSFVQTIGEITISDTALYNVTNDGEQFNVKDDFSSTTLVSTRIEFIEGKDMELQPIVEAGQPTSIIKLTKK